jgi:hypothetical protein
MEKRSGNRVKGPNWPVYLKKMPARISLDSLADLNLSANNLLIFLFLQHGKFGFK